MGSRECPTCLEEYDSRDHRVRILQCGHSQCTSCMRAQFSGGRITCASCRATHVYTNIESIPICYIAEKYKEEMDAAPLAPKLHKGICEEHASFKLFWCNKHHEWICTHCSVTEHPRGDCDIISIKKQFDSDKVLKKSKIYEEIKHLDHIKNEATLSIEEKETHIKKMKDEIEEEQNHIKKKQDEIEAIRLIISQKEREVSVINHTNSKLHTIQQDCEKKKSALENISSSFHNVRTFKELDVENEKCLSRINTYIKWRKGLEEDKDLSLKISSNLPILLEKLKKSTNIHGEKSTIDYAKKMLRQNVKKTKMYATKKVGNATYVSSIEQLQGSIVLNSLKQSPFPNTDSPMFEFNNVMRLASTPPVVFLTLSYKWATLGCLHIRLDGRPGRVRQFLELSTGSSGRGSYKGAMFDCLIDKGTPKVSVHCGGFINAAGTRKDNAICQVEDDKTVNTPITEDVVFGYPGQYAYFCIYPKGMSGTLSCPVIGHVISGLPDLQAAVDTYGDGDIQFSESGVVIDSSVENN